MNIDLKKLNKEIKLKEVISFTEEDLGNSDIKKLDNVVINGILYKDKVGEIVLDIKVTGVMNILDSISSNEVEYPFSFEINEKVSKKFINYQNTLDLKEILWENIVLEVPLRFTKEADLSKFQGDGWKLVDESYQHGENPFSEILEKMKKE